MAVDVCASERGETRGTKKRLNISNDELVALIGRCVTEGLTIGTNEA